MRKLFTVGEEVKDSIEEKGFLLKRRYDTSPEFNVLFLASKKKNRNGRLLITDSNDILRYELEVGIVNGFYSQFEYYNPENAVRAIVEERGRILVTRYLRSKYKKLDWYEWMKFISADEDGNYLLKVIQSLDSTDHENEYKPNIRKMINQGIAMTSRERVKIDVNGVARWVLIERVIHPQAVRKECDDFRYIGTNITYRLKVIQFGDYCERWQALVQVKISNLDLSYPNIKKVLPDLISLAQNTIATQDKIKNIK